MRAFRCILALAIYLALASAITVGVAWAIHRVHFQRLAGVALMLELSGPSGHAAFTDRAWNARRIVPGSLRSGGAPDIRPIRVGDLVRAGWYGRATLAGVTQHHAGGVRSTREMLSEFRAGWPMHALRHANYGASEHMPMAMPVHTASPPLSRAHGLEISANSLPTVSAFSRFALPLDPIWPGFLVNTLLTAACLALLVHGSRPVRALVWRWRGRCPACGYDLDGLEPASPCPECGRPPAARAAAATPGRPAAR